LAEGRGKVVQDSSSVLYTIAFNRVPQGSTIPLIGLGNYALGRYSGIQVGLLNYTRGNFKGLQLGLANTVSKNATGAQVGIINLARDTADVYQIGVINRVAHRSKGAQVGVLNISGKSILGAQVGVVNVAGAEAGGAQVGILNFVSKALRGFQVGFLNVVDTVESGIPIGVLSIVKNGGYFALELGANEMYPVNASFHTGTTSLYNIVNVGYSPGNKVWGYGLGFGTYVNFSSKFFFNPEAIAIGTVEKNQQQGLRLTTNVGFRLSKHFSIVAGPAITYVYKDDDNGNFHNPAFPIYKTNFGGSDIRQLFIGVGVSLRYKF
jgi:hypothetical protein